MSVTNTFLGTRGIAQLLKGRKKLWFIGIGGIQMHTLALACRAKGFEVGGSDTCASEGVQRLREAGVEVHVGHHPAAMADFDAVVYTLAIEEQDPEFLAAIALGLPVLSRADLLGWLSAAYPCRIGVAGSHGKSTVTAMLAEIFTIAGCDPTVFCGAMLPSGSAWRQGNGETCIYEACEYGNSFLALAPTHSLLLNVDYDHADFFENEIAFYAAFAKFAARTKKDGAILFYKEDENASKAATASPVPCRSFGLSDGDCYAKDLQYEAGRGEFSLVLYRNEVGRVRLLVPGEHNVKNALAAALCAAECGIEPKSILQGLASFKGAARRMEYRGLFCGVQLFDDYAHHPREIATSIATARQITPKTGRVFAVFQPHTYSRTKAFFKEFCEALSKADRVILTDIYPAREKDTLGISAAALAEAIGSIAHCVSDLAEIPHILAEQSAPGDTLLVMGAGNIDRLFGQICANHFTLS